MEIVEVKKHNIDTFDIYINIKDRLSYEDIKKLDEIVKEETDRYIEFLGIDKNCIVKNDYDELLKQLKSNFTK